MIKIIAILFVFFLPGVPHRGNILILLELKMYALQILTSLFLIMFLALG